MNHLNSILKAADRIAVIQDNFERLDESMAFPSGFAGVKDLASGDAGGTVTFSSAELAALSAAPTSIVLTLQIPDSSSFALFAFVVGAMRTNGFDFGLSAATNATGYKLHYFVIP